MSTQPRILIVDDDPSWRNLHGQHLTHLGYAVSLAGTLKEALSLLEGEGVSVVLLDVQLPDGIGIDILSELRRSRGHPEVIVVSGHADKSTAASSIQADAFTFLSKGRGADADLTRAVMDALSSHGQTIACQRHAPQVHAPDLVGKSKPFVSQCLNVIAECAPSEVSVLVLGETGTGKTEVARAIHDTSRRASGPFIPVDCTTMTDSLIDSQLFGHVKGSYTDARAPRAGLIAAADKGTLFLDEVGDLTPKAQGKLLRVLEERRIRRVGSDQEIEVDFRLIAATNKDLKHLMRSDLYYRLLGIEMTLPPLRERTEDIPLIVEHHLGRMRGSASLPAKAVSPSLMAELCAYEWPGNIRELVNALKAAVVDAKGSPVLFTKNLPLDLRIRIAQRQLPADHPCERDDLPDYKTYREQYIASMDRRYLEWLIDKSEGSWRQAVAHSGLAKSRLYEFLGAHHLSLKSRNSP